MSIFETTYYDQACCCVVYLLKINMKNEFWINLATKDVLKAQEFFIKIGFILNNRHQAPHMVSLFVGHKQIVVNIFAENIFQNFIGGQPITNTNQSNEVLFSIGAESPEEVDKLAQKVIEAGGSLYAQPGYKDGWMYGCGFKDLDGHRWNILYMDISKMPK